MGRLMYSENGKWLIRNYAGRRMYNAKGECRRVVVTGEMIVLDRSHRANGELPDVEIHESPDSRHKKSLVPPSLKESKMVKAVLVAFALGAWAVWTAITLLMLFN